MIEGGRRSADDLRNQAGLLEVAESKAYTAVGHANDMALVHSYLKIKVHADRIEIHPVGVGLRKKNAKRSTKLSPIPVKKLNGETIKTGTLRSIVVRRNQTPKSQE